MSNCEFGDRNVVKLWIGVWVCGLKLTKSWKIENKRGRLGRFKNRNEARKKVMNSWDRDLSIGNLKWCVWGRECGQSKSGFRFWDQKLYRARWGLAFGARNFNVLTWFSSPKLEILKPKIVLVQNLIQNWCLVLFGYFQISLSQI